MVARLARACLRVSVVLMVCWLLLNSLGLCVHPSLSVVYPWRLDFSESGLYGCPGKGWDAHPRGVSFACTPAVTFVYSILSLVCAL